MRVCVQGLWHLGSVTAACLASVGHEVVGVDFDQTLIASLREGKAPLFEPNLNLLIAEGIQDNNLRFTSDIVAACKEAEVLWVTFDTPVNDDDVADVEFVINHIKSAVTHLSDGALVLVSSQLPVGSVLALEKFTFETFPNKHISFASSPENLRLGKALDVFLHPDRMIVGVRTSEDRAILERLIFPITKKIEWMSVESAEMTKHAINAFLATSVAFANEVATICELVGADAKEVERGLKSESRIGPKAYLSPGGPFAGGTLARDIEFLSKISQDQQLITPLISSIRLSNDAHKKWVQRKLLGRFSDLNGVRVGIWGLTYKAGTDTLPRSLSVELVDWLLERGALVQVYDPVVKTLPNNWANRVKKCMNAYESLENLQVLVVGTELPEFIVEARRLPEVADSNLLVIDANRYLQASLDGADLYYLSVGSRK